MDKIDVNDNGISSRKFWFALFTSVAIFSGAVLATVWHGFGPNYETLIGGLIGCLAVYTGANIGSKYVLGKHRVAQDAIIAPEGANEAPDDEEPPEGQAC